MLFRSTFRTWKQNWKILFLLRVKALWKEYRFSLFAQKNGSFQINWYIFLKALMLYSYCTTFSVFSMSLSRDIGRERKRPTHRPAWTLKSQDLIGLKCVNKANIDKIQCYFKIFLASNNSRNFLGLLSDATFSGICTRYWNFRAIDCVYIHSIYSIVAVRM